MTEQAIQTIIPHVAPLTSAEVEQLKHYQGIIDRNMTAVRDVGTALRKIRDLNLFREYGTLENYCHVVCEFGRAEFYRYMDAPEVLDNLSPIGDDSERIAQPTRMAHIRELAPYERDQQRSIMKGVAERLPEGEAPTARLIKEVATEFYGVGPTAAGDEEQTTAFLDDFRNRKAAREGAVTLDKSSRPASGPPGVAKEAKPSHNERYTPAKYVEAARRVMGGIDCDPASCARANRVVQATVYYSKEHDGRTLPWPGRNLVNPPYKADELGEGTVEWVDLLLAKFSAGEVTQAVLIVNALTETKWYQKLAARFPVCITDHRIHYEDGTLPEDEQVSGSPANGSAFFYLGPNREAFIREFWPFGVVQTALHPVGYREAV